MEWKKVNRDKIDVEKGYNLCPKCNAGLEKLVEDGIVKQERCTKGCYVFDFDLMKRIK